MEPLQIAGLYIALNLILAVVLIYRVVKIRISDKISMGDDNNPVMAARIRAHGNFIENTPLMLIGLFTLASLSAHVVALHICGIAILLCRLLHAYGMAQPHANGQSRRIGMMLTFVIYISIALYLLYIVIAG